MPGLAGSRSPRRGRLSRSADFDRVFRSGRSHAGRDLVLYVFPRGADADGARLGLSVSRKVGGAVERNRVKRLLREAFAEEGVRLPAGTDAVVIARPGAGPLAEREGLAGIRQALGELVGKVPGAGPAGGDVSRSTSGLGLGSGLGSGSGEDEGEGEGEGEVADPCGSASEAEA